MLLSLWLTYLGRFGMLREIDIKYSQGSNNDNILALRLTTSCVIPTSPVFVRFNGLPEATTDVNNGPPLSFWWGDRKTFATTFRLALFPLRDDASIDIEVTTKRRRGEKTFMVPVKRNQVKGKKFWKFCWKQDALVMVVEWQMSTKQKKEWFGRAGDDNQAAAAD